MTPVSISEARDLGKLHGFDRLVIIAVNHDGHAAFTSYGKDKATCQALKRWVEHPMAEDVALDILQAT